ncbi:MAG: PAS domain S-box protein [Candidatus Electrothrix sp. LOE1_4_5]|nr:PAS domain S-box protein [Candidatus Electrothrix gigas]
MQSESVPFYRRLRFSMMLTVLVLVTLISGTSILISYYVTSQKIERDVATEFLNTERVANTFFKLFRQQLLLTAEGIANELILRQIQNVQTGKQQSLVAMFRSLQEKERDGLHFLSNDNGEVFPFSDKDTDTVASLFRHKLIQKRLKNGNSFTTIVKITAHQDIKQEQQLGQHSFYIVAAVPVKLPSSNQRFFVFSCFLIDDSFLLRFPIYSQMDITLVSDNIIVATTLPPEKKSHRQGDTSSLYNSSVLLPGAIELIHESSFFKEKMYVKIKYIPGVENSTTSFFILSHPSRLVLATKKEFGQHFIIILLVGLCCSIILIFFITGSVLNPIKELKQLVDQISEGNLGNRIQSSVSNEFTPLINQFNNMLNLIQRKDEELWDIVEVKTTELRQRNVFIDNLLRSSQVMGIVATDMNLVVTYFNPVAEKLFGFKAQDVVGKKVTEFHPHIKNREEQFNTLIDNALRKGSYTFTVGMSDLLDKNNIEDEIQEDNKKGIGKGKAAADRQHKGEREQRIIEVYLSPIKAKGNKRRDNASGLMLMAQDITTARRMDERLHSALEELKVILDNTMLGLILVQNERIVRVNTTFESMFGYSFDEIVNMPWSRFRSAIFAGKEAECWDGSGRMFSMVKKTALGIRTQQPFWSKVRQVSIGKDRYKETKRELYLFEDMSSQTEMFEKIQRLSQAVEQSSNSVVITSIDGVIEYVNRTFVSTTGYDAHEIIDQSLEILAPTKAEVDVYKKMWSTVRAGKEWVGELVNKKKDGDFYEENVVASPIRNEEDEITHIIVTKENITDLKKARQQADSANRAKSEFLANMSHEIRTPMNSIIGMTELLLETTLLPEQKGYVENVNSSASVLLSLINDILDFSKIEAGKLELDYRPFKPQQLVEEVVETLKILAEQKGIELLVNVVNDDDCYPLGDSLRIRQVLLNLVGNAIKFTHKGNVTLEATIRSTHANYCSASFTISDTGIGISQDQQENIFANFTQADSSITRDFGGTGLGLAISNRLLQLMGSEIYLKSTLGVGSVFSFNILLEEGKHPEAGTEQQQEIVPDSQRCLDVLLVEDNPANQRLAVIILEKQGQQVTVANNGLEALSYLSRQHFDLIFMDMQMPVMDGLTATRYIRQVEKGIAIDLPELDSVAEQLHDRLIDKHVYIVAVTANAMYEDRKQCLEAGMDEYLSKPYKKYSLLKILHNFDENNAKAASSLPSKKDQEKEEEEEIAVVVWDEVMQHLMKQFELEQEDAETVLSTYADSLAQGLVDLRKNMENGEGIEGGRQAHAMKGGLLNLGLSELAETAFVLEKELPKEIEQRHFSLLEKLAQALKGLIVV